MAKLSPYNIKVRVYCSDDAEARQVQQAVQDIASGTNIIGSETLQFYARYKQNESIIRPVITDVMRNGIMSISRHLLTLRKIK